jgi:hypothetical protein
MVRVGRILNDDQVINQCNIKESDFIVAMPGKVRVWVCCVLPKALSKP